MGYIEQIEQFLIAGNIELAKSLIESVKDEIDVLSILTEKYEPLFDEDGAVDIYELFGNSVYCGYFENEIPECFYNLKHIKLLFLAGCNLKHVDRVFEIPTLKIVDLSANEIEEININVKCGIKKLNLSLNKITKINGIENLTELEQLEIENNFITDIQKFVKLPKLESFNAYNNLIETLPIEWGSKLTILNLGYNKIKTIQNEFYLNTQFEYLNFICNRIEKVDKSITNLRNLTYLNFGHNKLRTVPVEIANMNLETLHISGNRILKLHNKVKNANIKNLI